MEEEKQVSYGRYVLIIVIIIMIIGMVAAVMWSFRVPEASGVVNLDMIGVTISVEDGQLRMEHTDLGNYTLEVESASTGYGINYQVTNASNASYIDISMLKLNAEVDITVMVTNLDTSEWQRAILEVE